MTGPSITHNFVRPSNTGIKLGLHKDAILGVYFFFLIFGGHFCLPLLLATIFFTKTTKRRHPTLINLLMSAFVYATACLILLYSGEQRKPEPKIRRLFGAGVTYLRQHNKCSCYRIEFGASVMVGFQRRKNRKEFKDGTCAFTNLIKNVQLLLMPWAFFLLIVIVSVVYGVKNPDNVSTQWVFYCTISSKAVISSVGAFTISCVAITLVFQCSVLRTLYKASKQFKAANQSSYYLTLRSTVATIYMVAIFIIAVVLVLVPTLTFAYLFIATFQLHRRTEDAGSQGCPLESVGCNTNPDGHELTPAQSESISLAINSASASTATPTATSAEAYVPHTLSPQASVGIAIIVALALTFVLVGVAIICGCHGERCCMTRRRKGRQMKAEQGQQVEIASPNWKESREFGVAATMTTAVLPTERTALLNRPDSTSSLPYILSIEKAIYASSELPDSTPVSPSTIVQGILIHSTSLPSRAAETALALLLCLRCLSGSNNMQRISRSEIERFVVQKWTELENEETDEVLHQILWMSFPIDEGTEECHSVIEIMLAHGSNCPFAFLLDSRVASSLLKTWKEGKPVMTDNSYGSTFKALTAKLQKSATPRVLHLIELTFFFGYLGIFTNYIMDPPYNSIFENRPRPDYRSYYLMIYAASRILKGSWTSPVSFYLSLFAFVSSLPSTPEANDTSYTPLLLSFSLHIIQLLVPQAPSSVTLIPQTFAFPLSVMLQDLITSIFIPAFFFFLPVFLVSFVLLSISVSDIFLAISNSMSLDPAPANARLTLLTLLFILLILFFSLITSMVLSSPSRSPTFDSSPAIPRTWDMYGSNVSLSVRQHFLRSISIYSTPHFFPAPLNLLWIIMVYCPCTLLRMIHQKRWAVRIKGTVEPVLWKVAVMPLALVFGAFWAWGMV
ncbi:hypothetical protein EW145_g1256 [Phellinidium pouzarii]|uniref:Uncharacterized protein n=1 Tax=Phellinidium pouzarii TaxID=167371 RepID=A0A4S4LH04_9AGAM|nr:hypothetical protein EW145_g1256 [Phellinidium pouzarii]